MSSQVAAEKAVAAAGGVYAEPRTVTDLDECYFYHTMNIPSFGVVKGPWDLRGSVRDYLGRIDFEKKRVLEIGTASGFLCFSMEAMGAEVVAYDLSEEQSWDVVPYAGEDYTRFDSDRRAHIRKINNAYWLSHAAHESSAKMVYGTVYAVPEEIGMVDVATFGNVLRHVRDPFLALQNALRLTRETVVVTENPSVRYSLPQMLAGKLKPGMAFLPNPRRRLPRESWWLLTPDVIRRFIGVLGFEQSSVIYHLQRFKGRRTPLYTVVGSRTRRT